ncbi:hypothetical protein H1R20_g13870, partial [Candolleomyces eurysporus]
MSWSTRWIFVDDTDSSIRYSGAWLQSSESITGADISGPIYGGTQRRINTSDSEGLTYTFSGTGIRVIGTSALAGLDVRDVDPRWACSIDGTTLDNSQPSPEPQNQHVLCQTALADGRHTLNLRTESRGTPFWFDFLMINPSLSDARSIANPAVFYSYQDPAIQYRSGQWRNTDEVLGMLTQEAQASLFLSFNGTKVTWYGAMLSGFPTGASGATYSIDGGSPVTFTIPGLSLGGATRFQQVFFETDTLPMGEHNISVQYLGASSPLVLQYLIIQNGDIMLNGNTPPPSVGDIEPSKTDKHHEGSHTGVIVGGAIGGVALLVLLAIIFFLLRKLKQRRVAKQLTNIDDDGPTSPADHRTAMAEAIPFISQSHPERPTSMAYTNTTPGVSPSPSALTNFSMQQSARPLSGQTSNSALMQPQRMSTHTFSSAGAGANDGVNAQRSSQALAQLYDPSVASQFGAGASTGYAATVGASTSSSGPPPPPSGSSVDSAREEKRRLQYHYENNNNPTVLAPPPSLPNYGSSSAAMASGSGGPPVDGQEPTLVHHQDSGIRMGAPSPQFVDVPPSYTPQ